MYRRTMWKWKWCYVNHNDYDRPTSLDFKNYISSQAKDKVDTIKAKAKTLKILGPRLGLLAKSGIEVSVMFYSIAPIHTDT